MLAQAFPLYDPTNTGYLDRTIFRKLFADVGMNLAEWELGEIAAWGDTARDGRINYRELLRQYDFAAQTRAAADAANARVGGSAGIGSYPGSPGSGSYLGG